MDIAHHQRYRFFFAASAVRGIWSGSVRLDRRRRIPVRWIRRKLAFKAHNAEVSPARREIGFRHLAKCERRTHIFIIGERLTLSFLSTTLQTAMSPANRAWPQTASSTP